MKKKIVIEISTCCEKCRVKAMKTAAVADGVISVAFEGSDREKLIVIGERVDAACLTRALRKKVSYANLVLVEEVKPPEEKKPDKPEEKNPDNPCNCCHGRPNCELVNVIVDPNPSTCTIM
ncbi:hypothetical protein JCGZ_01000 [Jatropha curcas]|uniref:HMA domain-containing protein n=1 Tax=Jatropha curcas TaxID=180498 RepID=A0A067KWB9_JATCU|nr:hypothetical protein JCGZ_01000 [Jatropha curcas]